MNAPTISKAFPVKNTFIHFDTTDADIHDQPLPRREEKDEPGSAESEQLRYWLPSLSSSSDASRKQRAASFDCGRSSRSSGSEDDREQDFRAMKAQLAQIRDGYQQQRASWLNQSAHNSDELFNASSNAGVVHPKQEPLEEYVRKPPPPAEESRGTDWKDGLMGMFRDFWESGSASAAIPSIGQSSFAQPWAWAGGSGADSASSSAAPPSTLHALARVQPEQLLERVPRNEEGELTSLGSAYHQAGNCTPCPFWFKGVCLNGVACRHCHYVHEGQRPRRLRPSKQGRERLRKRMEQEMESGGQSTAPGPAGYSPNPSTVAAQLSQAAEKAGLKIAAPPQVASAVPQRPGPRKAQMSL